MQLVGPGVDGDAQVGQQGRAVPAEPAPRAEVVPPEDGVHARRRYGAPRAARHLERQLAGRPPAPGCRPGSRSSSPTCSACRRRSAPTTPSRRWTSPPGATRSCPTARGGGTAWPSPAGSGSTTSGPGCDDADLDVEARLLTVRCGDVHVITAYVPNGRTLDAPQYEQKLAWLARLQALLAERFDPAVDQVVLCGDLNIAPDDRDVYDPALYVGTTHTSAPERAAFAGLVDWGLVDVFRAALRGGRPVLVVGLPCRQLPQGQGHAHRPRAGHAAAGRPGRRRPHRPERPQGREALGPRPRRGGLRPDDRRRARWS